MAALSRNELVITFNLLLLKGEPSVCDIDGGGVVDAFHSTSSRAGPPVVAMKESFDYERPLSVTIVRYILQLEKGFTRSQASAFDIDLCCITFPFKTARDITKVAYWQDPLNFEVRVRKVRRAADAHSLYGWYILELFAFRRRVCSSLYFGVNDSYWRLYYSRYRLPRQNFAVFYYYSNQ